jgi:hypothetical protein
LKTNKDRPERAAKRKQGNTARPGIKHHQPGKTKPDKTDYRGRHPFDRRR